MPEVGKENQGPVPCLSKFYLNIAEVVTLVRLYRIIRNDPIIISISLL